MAIGGAQAHAVAAALDLEAAQREVRAAESITFWAGVPAITGRAPGAARTTIGARLRPGPRDLDQARRRVRPGAHDHLVARGERREAREQVIARTDLVDVRAGGRGDDHRREQAHHREAEPHAREYRSGGAAGARRTAPGARPRFRRPWPAPSAPRMGVTRLASPRAASSSACSARAASAALRRARSACTRWIWIRLELRIDDRDRHRRLVGDEVVDADDDPVLGLDGALVLVGAALDLALRVALLDGARSCRPAPRSGRSTRRPGARSRR